MEGRSCLGVSRENLILSRNRQLAADPPRPSPPLPAPPPPHHLISTSASLSSSLPCSIRMNPGLFVATAPELGPGCQQVGQACQCVQECAEVSRVFERKTVYICMYMSVSHTNVIET